MNKQKGSFLDYIHNGNILIADGGMGTLLSQSVNPNTCVEALNLTAPEKVEQAHASYIEAGSQLIETNSFGINYHKLKPYKLEDKVEELCTAAVTQAKKARANKPVWIAGSVGPLTQRRRELDLYTEDDIQGMYLEAMQALANAGVDLIVLETFTRISDLDVALSQAKKIGLPILAQMAFGDHGVTDEGVSVEKFKQVTQNLAADAIGSNCKIGPHLVSSVVHMQSQGSQKPISVFPNAGYAQQVDGRYVYGASPKYFAQKLAECVSEGAQILGGCCGTSPEHIQALHALLESQNIKQVELRKPAQIEVESSPHQGDHHDNAVLAKIKSPQIFTTVEVEPPKDLNLSRSLENIQMLCQAGCDALNIPDNPLSIVRPDHVIFADIVKQHADIPVILHLTCRDKNLIALRSNILGAMMAKVDSILAVTGDPASLGGHPGATSVYDVQSVGLIELIDSMNEQMQQSHPLSIGVAFNPNIKGELGVKTAMDKLAKKIKAGAHFIETQPIFDLEKLEFMTQQKQAMQLPVCLGIMPLLGQKNAEFLHNEVPGMKIPKEIRQRLTGLKRQAAQQEGLNIAKEIIDQAKAKGFNNFYIIPPMKKYHLAAELVEHIHKK
ncbi:bifunctional homocysteine S-methyltransferase/methylenetetrahydrofolate reductase [bacterium]|nr:bifunctional homocysteine S-methyltransferase/methylenetetrahydrofolate reductase [bacterium]